MSAHSLTRKAWRRPPARRPANPVVQLGWPHFWLLIGILAGTLGLVAWVLVVHNLR